MWVGFWGEWGPWSHLERIKACLHQKVSSSTMGPVRTATPSYPWKGAWCQVQKCPPYTAGSSGCLHQYHDITSNYQIRGRGELVWGPAMGSGGGVCSHWDTRTWEPGNMGVTPCYWTKLGSTLLSSVKPVYWRQVVVKESEAIIIKVPKQRGQVACALNPKLPEGFQQSSYKGHTREGATEFVIRWCTVFWLVS